jgi:hypothetical protein
MLTKLIFLSQMKWPWGIRLLTSAATERAYTERAYIVRFLADLTKK